MKVGLDENISQRFFLALRALGPGKGVNLRHVAKDYGIGNPDTSLIHLFVADGGEVLVSGDGRMPNLPHQVQALVETGLLIIFVPPRWSQQKGFWKAAFLIRWWTRLVAHSSEMIGGNQRAWRIPYKWEGGDFEAVKLVSAKNRQPLRP